MTSPREKPNRDENRPAHASFETSDEAFPLLETSLTWYPQ